MERVSTYVTGDVQIKTGYWCPPIMMAKIWNTDNPKCWQEHGARGMLIHCDQECEHTGVLGGQSLTKGNILFPHHPAMVLLRISPKDLKTHVDAQTARSYLQQLCLQSPKLGGNQEVLQEGNGEAVVHRDNGIALKRNEPSSYKKVWKNPKCIRPSERSQWEQAVRLQLHETVEKAKVQTQENQQWLPGVWG